MPQDDRTLEDRSTCDDDEPGDQEACWYCHGDGGFHECGEDCCCCLDKEEITEVCPECHGSGLL